MADSKKNLDLLRKCGIQEWILGDDSVWKGFFDFFQNNITEENILTDEELFELSSRKSNDHGMSDLELIERKTKISKEYNGIWSITENNVTAIQKELETTKETEEQYKALILEAKKENINITEEITSLEIRLDKERNNETYAAQQCLKQMEELEQIKSSVERKIIDLGQLYAKPSKSMLFMHQMSLNDYFVRLETFNKLAEQYTQRNFNVQNSTEESDRKDADNRKMYNELSKIADRLLNVYHKLFMEQTKANGKTCLISQLKKQNWTPSTLTAIRNEIAEMKREEQNIALEKNDLMMQLQEQAIELARLDVETVIFDNNKKRLIRAEERKQNIKRFVDTVSDAMIIAEIIWILMQFDIERMKKRNDFDPKLDKYRIDTLICDRRLEILKSASNDINDKLLRNYCIDVLKLLQPARKIQIADFTTDHVVECILGIHEFNLNMNNLLAQLGEKTQFTTDDLAFLERCKSNQNKLLKYLNDGPINKHQYWSIDYLKMKARLAEQLKKLSSDVGALKEESRYYIQKMNNDNLWSQKQILWIWFLTEPKKVLKAIKLIKTVAQRHSTEPTTRPLAGLLRKT